MQNTFPFPVTVYITRGEVQGVQIDGHDTGLSGAPLMVRVPAGSAVSVQFATRPSWAWFRD